MNTDVQDQPREPRWKTYFKAMAFGLPAVVAWGFACVMLVPKLKEICAMAGLELPEMGWVWDAPFFLVQFGRALGIALLVLLLLLELFSRGWGRYRPAVVGALVWMLNVAVLGGLTLLLVLVLVAAPGLARGP